MLRLRWALRDARARWAQVVAIALMIAIGTGLFAGLSSVTEWRIASNEASLDLTNMYDIRARLSEAGFLPRGSLAAIAEGIDGVEAAEERLIVQTQVEVESDDGEVFVPGRILGVDMSDGGPRVNGVQTVAGRDVEEREFGEPVVLLERNFAAFYGLPDSGEIRLGGGVAARYVGQGTSPEYFMVVEQGSFFGQANLAAVFTSLETAQRLANRPGMVNDLVISVEQGTALEDVEGALVAEMEARYPETGLRLMRPEDDASYLALTRDPEGDQQFYNVFAVVLFVGAAFAALNFAARMVETQRREIGASMALGVSPWAIAVRPLLVGVQIAVLGVVFGVGIGLLVADAMGGVLETFVPLPAYVTPFQTGIFAGVAASRLRAADPGCAVAGLPRGPRSAGGCDQDGTPGSAGRWTGARHQPASVAGRQPRPHAVPQPVEGASAHASNPPGAHRRARDALLRHRDDGLVPVHHRAGGRGADWRRAGPAGRAARFVLSDRIAGGGGGRERRRAARR